MMSRRVPSYCSNILPNMAEASPGCPFDLDVMLATEKETNIMTDDFKRTSDRLKKPRYETMLLSS